MAAAAICGDQEIRSSDFPPSLSRSISLAPASDLPKSSLAVSPEERQRLVQALEATKYKGTGRYNLTAAAKTLGIPRKTFSYRVRKLGLIP